MSAEHRNRDPREMGPKPPFPQQKISHPGSDEEMDPPADHGETSYHGHGRLKDRIAIVTGGDSGIDPRSVYCVSKEGSDIILSHLPEEKHDAATTAKQIKAAGRKAISMPGDIGVPEYAKSLVERAQKEFGRLDIVVNNAGFQWTEIGQLLNTVSSTECANYFASSGYVCT